MRLEKEQVVQKQGKQVKIGLFCQASVWLVFFSERPEGFGIVYWCQQLGDISLYIDILMNVFYVGDMISHFVSIGESPYPKLVANKSLTTG